jgi:hypothetical protein
MHVADVFNEIQDGNVPDKDGLGIEQLVSCCLICQCDELTHSFLRRRNVGLVEIVSDNIDTRHSRRFTRWMAFMFVEETKLVALELNWQASRQSL